MTETTPNQDDENTIFRDLLGIVSAIGEQAAWPLVLGKLFEREFEKATSVSCGYAGEVFKDRVNHRYEDDEGEEKKVAKLYHYCHEHNGGCIEVGKEKVLLLGFQWPSHGRRRMQRADLVGITEDGGLVVFEAKMARATNPMYAILEGLDYLACLLREQNFQKIVIGYEAWKDKLANSLDESFRGVCPKPKQIAKPSLIVLAPKEYFITESSSTQGREWLDLAKAADWIPSVNLQFATTDFDSSQAHVIGASS